MGATTIMYQQEDPTAKAISQAGNSIAETLQKQQSLKLTGQYYKILAKNAETEQEKFRFERLAKLNSDILPQIAGTKDPAMKAMLIKGVVDSGMYGGDAQTFMRDVGDSHQQVMTNHANVTGQDPTAQMSQMQSDTPYATPGQLAGAQAQNQAQEANLNAARAHMIQNPGEAFQKMTQGLQGATGGQGGVNGLPPGVSNQMMPSGATLDSNGVMSLQTTNPAVDYLKSQAGAMGSKMGDIATEQAPAKAVLGDYEAKLGLANTYAGVNAKDSDFSAGIKDKIAGIKGHFSPINVMEAKNAAKIKLGNQLTSAVEHGRPNNIEIAGVTQSVPDSDESLYTQQLKMAGLKAAFALPTTGDPYQDARNKITALNQSAHLGNTVEAFVQKRRARGIPESQIAQEVASLTGGASNGGQQ